VKTVTGKIRILFLCIIIPGLLALLIPNCRIDHGLEPVNSKIMGNLFFHGAIPRYTDEVRVAVLKTFPPSDIAELLFSEKIAALVDTVAYEIYLPPGTYAMVAAIWKAHNEPWNLSDIIGLYGGFFIGDQLVPIFQSVTLEDNYTVLDSIDIETNLNRVNRDSKIEGTVTFKGSWPDNTGVIGVGAFTGIPAQGDYIDYYLKNVDIDYTLPVFVNSADYQLRVHSTDTLRYIAVLWIDNTYDLTTIRDIGFYTDPGDSTQPGTVTAPADSTLYGVDIQVRF
jgi:hypothetical protein